MDWRGRKYYAVSFSPEALDMRIQFIKLIGSGVKVRFSTDVPRQKDELEERGRYQCLIGCRFDQSEAIEYELKKAERNDYYCFWREIKEAKKIKEIVAKKPVKVALDSAVMVVGDARGTIDVSAATLTDMAEMVKSVKATNDKFYEIIYKDGNLEMKEIK